MRYNALGKTGLEVSSLGLGGHEFESFFSGHVRDSHMTSFDPDRTAVIERALEGGVNYFDVFMLCNLSQHYTAELIDELMGIYRQLQQEGKFR